MKTKRVRFASVATPLLTLLASQAVHAGTMGFTLDRNFSTYLEASSPIEFGEETDLQYAPNASQQYKIAWGALTRPGTRNFVMNEIAKPQATAGFASMKAGFKVNSLPFSRMDQKTNDFRNPFHITDGDFFTGMYLAFPVALSGPVPTTPERDTAWFKSQVDAGLAPDVFVIGGHHVIGSGYHNDPENMFMFTPTLRHTIDTVPAARQWFDQVKIGFLWGCNTLTNLEPHDPKTGAFLNSEEIKAYYERGGADRKAMVGAAEVVNSLEFYRARLAREYGPGSHKFEYTRSPAVEKKHCETAPGLPYLNCHVTNVDRVLPDKALMDGEHRLNGSYVHKHMFRNAYLLLGFNSASPAEENRAKIVAAAFNVAYSDLNRRLSPGDSAYVSNIIRDIIDADTPYDRRVRVIKAVRSAWTEVTTKMNRGRPSGSITPALPELDRDGPFYLDPEINRARIADGKGPIIHSKDAPLYQPYEANIGEL